MNFAQVSGPGEELNSGAPNFCRVAFQVSGDIPGIAFDLIVDAVERVGAETFVYGTRQREVGSVAANPGELPPGELIVRLPGANAPAIGQHIRAVAAREKLHLFSADGRKRVGR